MVAGPRESKFSSPLVQAFAAYSNAASLNAEQKTPVQVLLIHQNDLLEEVAAILQSLIDADRNTKKLVPELHLWSGWEHAPFSPVSSSITQRIDRLKTLSALTHPRAPLIILASPESWIQPTLPANFLAGLTLTLQTESQIESREDLKFSLRKLGYVPSELVEEAGQFAFRGEILDIFLPTSVLPYRIDFFDTSVESIRQFHPETQRTWKTESPITTLAISPAEEVLIQSENEGAVLEQVKQFSDQNLISRKIRDPIFENIRNGYLPEHFRTWIPFVYGGIARLLDYLPAHARLVVFEPEQLPHSIDLLVSELKHEAQKYPNPYWITPSFELLYPDLKKLLADTLSRASQVIRTSTDDLKSRAPIEFENIPAQKVYERDINEWIDDGFQVSVATRGPSHEERIRFLLKGLKPSLSFRFLNYDSGDSHLFLLERQVFLSEDKILGLQPVGPKKPRKLSTQKFEQNNELSFQHTSDLSVGDLIVHTLHGVGKYLGLNELKSGDKHQGEYLLIEYSGGDKLYLPVYRLNTIQRYVSAGGNAPLDKLGTYQFEKAKQKARDSAKKLAVNLIEIYAKRALLKGPRFETQGKEYFDFVDQFEFQETEGQSKATQDVLRDLENGKLLDRLVCGDVGFGKTEVAMRAAFQAVNSGYQVAVLVPTTLLAFQHEQSFKKRMANFPVRIESISRFKNKRQQGEVVKGLEANQVDIVIGTHRLLSKDIRFKKLGLLVIDEEHRFGVDHKEKIKAIQADTHTLTLTATPIPRTLNMAIAGLKDISLIKTPPANRQPIKTFVSGYSEELVRSALENELSRGGQVFYLYNRVASIEHQANEIQKLVPHAKVIVAHGQMTEDEIESRMLDFYHGRAQVLVCTTIIESGIDVPNAGTILIHRADQLGLAQLYQIRGRVGRSHRKAYAYLLVNDEGTLTQEARMRLDVLQRFVELGSGFQIASHDLEIRGGGNFLGAEQSGHIASVGLDLFTEMLEEAIAELRGQKIVPSDDKHFEPEIQVPVVCEINPSVVPDTKLRLTLYRKLSNARTNAQVDLVREEFSDRFGVIPPETENLLSVIRIKNLLRRVGVEALSVNALKTTFTVRKSSLVEPDEVLKLSMGPGHIRDPRVTITPDSKIVYAIPFSSLQTHLFEIEQLLHKIAPIVFENAIPD
jgi:transcription-repair coupling factor (superfamily II helicase)